MPSVELETPQASPENGPVALGTSTPIISEKSAVQMNEETASFVVKAFSLTICAVILAIVGVLAYRVALDGDSPVTVQITQQLANLITPLVAALVASTVGNKAVSALLSKWTGGQ